MILGILSQAMSSRILYLKSLSRTGHGRMIRALLMWTNVREVPRGYPEGIATSYMFCTCDGGGCCEGETVYVAAHLCVIMTGGGAVKREGKRMAGRIKVC